GVGGGGGAVGGGAGGGGAGRALQLVDETGVPGQPFALVEQDQKQRRRVGRAVVGRVRPLLERGQLAEADLVEDLPGLLVAEGVDPLPLLGGQGAESRLGELGRETRAPGSPSGRCPDRRRS